MMDTTTRQRPTLGISPLELFIGQEGGTALDSNVVEYGTNEDRLIALRRVRDAAFENQARQRPPKQIEKFKEGDLVLTETSPHEQCAAIEAGFPTRAVPRYNLPREVERQQGRTIFLTDGTRRNIRQVKGVREADLVDIYKECEVEPTTRTERGEELESVRSEVRKEQSTVQLVGVRKSTDVDNKGSMRSIRYIPVAELPAGRRLGRSPVGVKRRRPADGPVL
eukprot:GHVP01044916.1.p1 GENE.GHVP01044916.1~~GHVP01044916.1.p1  ORF type:complete len:223 (-),score=18.59 GHVP01044916.1:1004-1672(-)